MRDARNTFPLPLPPLPLVVEAMAGRCHQARDMSRSPDGRFAKVALANGESPAPVVNDTTAGVASAASYRRPRLFGLSPWSLFAFVKTLRGTPSIVARTNPTQTASPYTSTNSLMGPRRRTIKNRRAP